MEAAVAERGQITLPKAVRDALGSTKGRTLKVELDAGPIILHKNVDDAVARVRGRPKLPSGLTTDGTMCELRGRVPGDPMPDARLGASHRRPAQCTQAVGSAPAAPTQAILIDRTRQ